MYKNNWRYWLTRTMKGCGKGCGLRSKNLEGNIVVQWYWKMEGGGEGRSCFHCPLYLGLFGFSVSNWGSKGEQLAPLETYKGLGMKGGAPVATTTGESCWWWWWWIGLTSVMGSSCGALGEDEICCCVCCCCWWWWWDWGCCCWDCCFLVVSPLSPIME